MYSGNFSHCQPTPNRTHALIDARQDAPLGHTMDYDRFIGLLNRYSVLGAYDEPQVGVHELFDEFYKNYGDEDHFGKLHQQLSSCVKRHLKKLSKKVIQLEKAMQDAQEAAQSQKQADLIMANIHK